MVHLKRLVFLLLPMDNATPSNAAPTQNKQPMLLGELMHNTWEMMKKNAKAIILLGAIVYLPLNALSTILATRVESLTPDNLGAFTWLFTGNLFLALLLFALAGVLVPLGIVAIVRASIDGTTLTFQDALRAATNHWLVGIKTTLLMGILLIPLMFLLVIPAIIFAIFWAFAVYVVMDDKLSGYSALKYSKFVVQGHWWKVLGNLLIMGLVAGIVGSIVSIPFSTENVVSQIIGATITSIVSMYSLVGAYLLYRNLKSLKPAAPNA